MTKIKLICQGASARAIVDGTLTAGTVGIPVEISCDSQWDGLTKTLVCMSANNKVPVILGPEVPTVAWETLVAGMHLYLGLEGRDSTGGIVIPTAWADCGKIKASSEGAHTGKPTPTEMEQILNISQNIILVQQNQPNVAENKMWVEPETTEYEILCKDGSTVILRQGYINIKDPVTGEYKYKLNAIDNLRIEKAVAKWLDEHPEATTSVQDKSLTVDKLTDAARITLQGGYKVLTEDITLTAAESTGGDLYLDLNGHTVVFAEGSHNYRDVHIRNGVISSSGTEIAFIRHRNASIEHCTISKTADSRNVRFVLKEPCDYLRVIGCKGETNTVTFDWRNHPFNICEFAFNNFVCTRSLLNLLMDNETAESVYHIADRKLVSIHDNIITGTTVQIDDDSTTYFAAFLTECSQVMYSNNVVSGFVSNKFCYATYNNNLYTYLINETYTDCYSPEPANQNSNAFIMSKNSIVTTARDCHFKCTNTDMANGQYVVTMYGIKNVNPGEWHVENCVFDAVNLVAVFDPGAQGGFVNGSDITGCYFSAEALAMRGSRKGLTFKDCVFVCTTFNHPSIVSVLDGAYVRCDFSKALGAAKTIARAYRTTFIDCVEFPLMIPLDGSKIVRSSFRSNRAGSNVQVASDTDMEFAKLHANQYVGSQFAAFSSRDLVFIDCVTFDRSVVKARNADGIITFNGAAAYTDDNVTCSYAPNSSNELFKHGAIQLKRDCYVSSVPI